jgi:paraquat-inducible protein B
VNSDELHQSITALHASLDSFLQLVTNLDRQLEPVASNLNLTLNDAREALQKADMTLDDIRGTMAQADTTLQSADALFSDEQVLTALDSALNEITSAAYAIRILAEAINNQPESLIRGRQ